VPPLNDLGLRVFLAERNLNAGENWEPTIRNALNDSKLVLSLITPESKTSGFVDPGELIEYSECHMATGQRI
jgi:hypothetical protein